jgi:thymidylate synthase (FAD)
MKTKLISLTSGSTDGKLLSAEELIVYTARVSNPENQMNFETSDRLISYLIKHKHWSPFEMADMTIEITTSRAIAAQILRHRSFSFQEFSQRYSKAQMVDEIQLRWKADTNRQSSSKALTHEDDYADMRLYGIVNDAIEKAFEAYNDLLTVGIAKECARMVLPLSTSTTMYMKGSIRSWIHYLEIRCDEHTQAEHRWIAEEIKEIFKTQLPNIAKALDW